MAKLFETKAEALTFPNDCCATSKTCICLDDIKSWKCVGCGVSYPGRVGNCDCATIIIYREDDNYEPPDPPGWEGGFADNH